MDEPVETFEDYYDSFDPDAYSHLGSSSNEPHAYLIDGDCSYHEDEALESFSSPLPHSPPHMGHLQSYHENTHPFQGRGVISGTSHFSTPALTPSRLTNLNLSSTLTPRRDLNQPHIKGNAVPFTRQVFDRHVSQSQRPSTDDRFSPMRRSLPESSGKVEDIPLISVSQLPAYRSLFQFAKFNAVQSACFSSIIEGDENMVISAPTGSGKTVLFELAILKMLMDDNRSDSKCVYISPTKALCSEKYREWSKKFDAMGVRCCELTGDTVSYGKGAWADARTAKIIVTTPEKLDSLSRNWDDHEAVFDSIRLICVDEVHILGEARGSTLEACLSRMKLRSNMRFILVSATVPNASDIADWIGSKDKATSAICMKFGDDYRPCKLTRHVYGYARNSSNPFYFDRTLDSKLFSILQRHCQGKPTLIFCSTRKGVLNAAEKIAKDFQEAEKKRSSVPWTPKKHQWGFVQPALRELACYGVGVHHAGLSYEDRHLTEEYFLCGKLSLLVATSTLAMGVNLPCHTVIIKGVEMWDGSKSREYPDLDIIQMIGRAGRPQFDKEGVAVILCDLQQRSKYQQVGTSLSTLESSLHQALAEHINSEIVLGSIKDVPTAHEWLKNTFLFRRIRANPTYYGIAKQSEQQTWNTRFDELVEETLNSLEENQLLAKETNGAIEATAFGVIASRSYVKQSSMSLIIKLPGDATKKDILWAISHAEEFKDIRLRQGEKLVYNTLCQHPDMRFEIKKVERPQDKVFTLLQAILGCISLSGPEYKNSDSVLALEAVAVYKHATRLIRSIVESGIVRRAGGILKHSLELHRSLTAKAWEDRPVVLRQLEGIGEKSIQVLALRGITRIQDIIEVKPRQLELWLNRKPPFGENIRTLANSFPRYCVTTDNAKIKSTENGAETIAISLQVHCSVKINEEALGKVKRQVLGMTSILTCTSSLDYIDYRRIPTRALIGEGKSYRIAALLSRPSDNVEIHISPDNLAGVAITHIYKPSILPHQFPLPDTRPHAVEALRHHLENSIQADTKVVKNQSEATKIHSSRVPDGHSIMKNGHYSCNHRCKDKTTCHHRCCQEGLSKPPPGLNGASSMESKRAKPDRKVTKEFFQRSESETKHTRKTGEDTSNKDNLLKQLDKLHQKTSTKSGFSSNSRITLPSKRNTINIEHPDDISSPIGSFSSSQEDGKAPAYRVSENYSDEEMEEAMASMPIPTLANRASHMGSRGLKRDLPEYSDNDERHRKKRKKSPGEKRDVERPPVKRIHSEIIEIDSTDSSTNSTQVNRDETQLTNAFKSERDTLKYCDSNASPPPLFSRSSSTPNRKVRNKLLSRSLNAKHGEIPSEDRTESVNYDDFFELDLNLFEGGGDAIIQVKPEGKLTRKEGSWINSEREGELESKKGTSALPLIGRQTMEDTSPSKVTSVDQQIRLFGDMSFDEFFSGIEIV